LENISTKVSMAIILILRLNNFTTIKIYFANISVTKFFKIIKKNIIGHK
jgi:hypothetical protein